MPRSQCFAEKRGNWWRGRYPDADGRMRSTSGYPTKAKALKAARDERTKIEAGTWQDPQKGEVSLADYVNERWLPAQQIAFNTRAQYRSVLKRHILPAFGDRPLNTLDSPEEISTWEISLNSQPQPLRGAPLSKTSARTCRKVLSFILGDAQAAGLISINAAMIRRKRGTAIADARAAAAEAEEKPWTTALQALLIAERAALLAGRDEEFTEIVTLHFTGMRWGEAVGLEEPYVRPGSIRIWWQLAEVNGVFVRIPPKFGSRRTIDIPGFLYSLLAAQMRVNSGRQCSCPRVAGEPSCEGTGHVFLGSGGAHQRRSGFATWIFKPAATGWFPAKRPHPAHPVPVTAEPWPGIPVRGRGNQARAEACWLPVLPGASPHACRHGRQTCMDRNGIQKVLRDLVMGHRTSGMEGVYAHIAPETRARLMAADERDWLAALEARYAISATSPVPVLDSLLSPLRELDRQGSPASPKLIRYER
jgi:integrase